MEEMYDGGDPTEIPRAVIQHAINSQEAERKELEAKVGQVWDTEELQVDFEVHNFLAPLVFVTRKSDNVKGSMMFQHMPRFYFQFEPM